MKLEQQEKLQSIGYKNIALSDKHVNAAGDVMLLVRLSIIKKEEPCHSLSSDLGSLINDEASSDLILEAGERRFRVHRNILAARSPVFASLLTQLEQEIKANEGLEEVEEKVKERRCVGQERIEEETEEEVTCEETEVESVPKERSPEVEEEVDVKEKAVKEVEDSQEKGEKTKAAVKKLVIENLPGDTVEELLRYIYTDNSNNVDLFSQTLLAASDIYQVLLSDKTSMSLSNSFPILTRSDKMELVAFKMKMWFDFWCPSMQIPILSNMTLMDERPGKDLKQRKEKSMQ